jgi:hypothetical protein
LKELNISFVNRCYCFTGKLADLKRSQAEREVRARGGMTTEIINNHLDYLVVGSIPSSGWKFGSYGKKIELARTLSPTNGGRPRLISEGDFTDALAIHPPKYIGAIDTKIFVGKYKFIVEKQDDFDADALAGWLKNLQETELCHVRVRSHFAAVYEDLFLEESGYTGSRKAIVVECRIVKQMGLFTLPDELVEKIINGFEEIRGVDGRFRWFERVEGSSDYVRLLKEIPQNLRAEGL